MATSTLLVGVPAGSSGYDTELDFAGELPLFEDMMLVENFHADLLLYEQYAATIHSPAQTFHSSAGADSSCSPTNASFVLTPTSTLLDYHGSVDVRQDMSTSPDARNFSPSIDDYVMVEAFGNEAGDSPPVMSSRALRAAAVPATPSWPTHRSRPPPAFSIPSTHQHHWPSFSSASTIPDEWMDQSAPDQYNPAEDALYSIEDAVSAAESFNQDPPSTVASFDGMEYSTSLPLGTLPDGGVNYGYPPVAQTYYPNAPQDFNAPTRGHRPHHPQLRGPSIPPVVSSRFVVQSQAFPPGAVEANRPAAAFWPSQNSLRTGFTPQAETSRSLMQPPHPSTHHAPTRQTQAQANQAAAIQLRLRQQHQSLQPAIAGPSRINTNTAATSSQIEVARRGGRKKGSNLEQSLRTKSGNMRRTGACWWCALQRDSCPDENTPCARCIGKAQKGSMGYQFPCNRSKLPDFVHDFLPSLMTSMHQKDTIENYVQKEVRGWDHDNPLQLDLTSGYGPPLRWKLYEFEPRSPGMLVQLQYLQDTSTGVSVRHQKYSPPLALLRIDTSDRDHFEMYMDQLLHEDYLWEFGWTCFEEETQIDPFQAELLQLLCNLYMRMRDVELKLLLEKILRMLLITYIMGHTLTIVEDTLFGVLSSLRHPWQPAHLVPHTSPRLANRQLKYFFSAQRDKAYEAVLNALQQTLRSSGRREASWLPSFCAMLGLAMVLEEQQRTLHIQADAKAAKRELPRAEAETEARNACARIDERFELLTRLFQMKYRDKKWTRGSFGNATPELEDEPGRLFLAEAYELLRTKAPHLSTRKDVEFAPQNQCLYTSRLVARFLLPFLGLPP